MIVLIVPTMDFTTLYWFCNAKLGCTQYQTELLYSSLVYCNARSNSNWGRLVKSFRRWGMYVVSQLRAWHRSAPAPKKNGRIIKSQKIPENPRKKRTISVEKSGLFPFSPPMASKPVWTLDYSIDLGMLHASFADPPLGHSFHPWSKLSPSHDWSNRRTAHLLASCRVLSSHGGTQPLCCVFEKGHEVDWK